MKKITNIYAVSVMEAIKQGKVVYCCDKVVAEVIKVNNMTVDEAAHILNNVQQRYDFWYVEDVAEGDAEEVSVETKLLMGVQQ